jgi:cystathionine beta-lyase family protein involved in aluminum resistance
MVDNCYCEFVTTREPIEVGADICAGSLIKNLGGGIAPNGAYVVGRSDLINLVSERLTAPGIATGSSYVAVPSAAIVATA